MGRLWSVKEIRDLTGLTGKHLYYYHHEGVARATSYSNYSVEGHDGYKLYDDAGVAKLQQIAMYHDLGLKRNEIRDIMLAPNYDVHRALDDLQVQLEEKRNRLDRHLAAIDQLRQIGVKNGLIKIFSFSSLDELGGNALRLPNSLFTEWGEAFLEEKEQNLERFENSFEQLLQELSELEGQSLLKERGVDVVRQIFEEAIHYLGLFGYLFVSTMFLSVMGEGAIAKEIFSDEITSAQREVIASYLKNDMQLLLEEVAQIIAGHHETIGGPLDTREVKEMVIEIKKVLASHFGLKNDDEYCMIFKTLDIAPYTTDSGYLNYVINALKFHTTEIS